MSKLENNYVFNEFPEYKDDKVRKADNKHYYYEEQEFLAVVNYSEGSYEAKGVVVKDGRLCHVYIERSPTVTTTQPDGFFNIWFNTGQNNWPERFLPVQDSNLNSDRGPTQVIQVSGIPGGEAELEFRMSSGGGYLRFKDIGAPGERVVKPINFTYLCPSVQNRRPADFS